MSTQRGGRFQGTENKDVSRTTTCPICEASVTKRQSREVRGARFCKAHGDEHSIIAVMHHQKQKEQREAKKVA